IMPFDAQDNTFLLAGPVKMHPRVLRAMSVPAVAHRDPGFVDVNRRIQEGMKAVSLDNGKFGGRFATLAQTYGDATVLKAPWGQPIDLHELAQTVARVKP